MKPPGGNYKPDRMNINRIIKRAPGGEADTGGPAGQTRGGDAGSRHVATAARVMSASPLELILIMYDQFFELIPDIKRSIERKSAAAMEPDSERAQAIIDELINALDFDVEISKDLGAIYFYVRNRILEANIHFDAAIWDDIESVMRPLYEGFKEAERQHGAELKQPVMSAVNPSIVAGMTYGQNSLKEIVVNTKSGLQV